MKKLLFVLLLLSLAAMGLAACTNGAQTTAAHTTALPVMDTTAAQTTAAPNTDTVTTPKQTASETSASLPATTPEDTSAPLADTTPAVTAVMTTTPETTAVVTTAVVTTAPITYTAENFMIAIDDKTPLSMIALPGTHDSGATKDMILSGTAKCQTMTIAEQLSAGVRYFDIRLRREDGALHVYHGTVDQDLTFAEVLDAFYNFLDKNPSEALIVCIKEETDATGTNDAFDTMVKNALSANAAKWYTGSAIPTLGSVRGKCVLWRRFATSSSYGFDASHDFADNSRDFTITNGAYKLRAQDYYQNDSGDAKWEAVEAFLAVMAKPSANTYYLNNTSGYKPGSFGIPNINTIKNHVNPLLLTYLEAKPSLVGIIATDFMTAEIAEAIYSLNFN
ncbi:MAG: phosphatidylinositol-specific phospholipase C domain-containing protein [Clostridia bacterium]|nr:phosphatidylinositol-specific phospholipase C domain-containing protein [Clostridia bacterium]